MVAAIDRIGYGAVAEDGVVGLSIGVAIEGRLLYARGFGHADAARTVPATEQTVFDIASVGKHFTAAAVLPMASETKVPDPVWL